MASNWTHIVNSPNSNHNTIELAKNKTENDLSGLAGAVTTEDFQLANGETATSVNIMAREVLSSAVTLTGDGAIDSNGDVTGKDIDTLISDYNSTASSGQEIFLRYGDGSQVLASGQTIVVEAGLTGVTHSINKQQLDVYEVDENTRMVIRGILYHDPDQEILILHHNNKGISGATYNGGAVSGGTSAFTVSGGNMWEKAYYYYGKEYTDTQTGRVTYSKGTGLIIAGDMSSVWHPTDAGLSGGNHNSFYVMRGGVVKLNRMMTLGCKLDILKTTFVGNDYSRLLEMRNPIGNNSSPQLNATFDKIAILEPAKPYPINLDLQGGTIGEVTAGGSGAWGENELKDLDLSRNTGPYDIGSDSDNKNHHQDWIIVNSETGSDVRKMWRDTRTNTGQRGVVIVKKEVSLNVKDGDGNPIEGAKVYTKDNTSSTSRDTKFLASKSNTDTNPFTKPTLSNADVDSDGNLIYYYADPLEYDFTTDANGDTATEKITTAVQAHEYNANDPDALTINGGPYNMPGMSGGKWSDDGNGGTVSSVNGQPVYSDWDTDKFGGFYKVDRRGNGNTNADEFTFYFCSYGELLSNNTQSLKGLGELEINWTLFADPLITQANRTTVDDYIAITDSNQFYDRAKSYLTANYAGEEDTLVTRSGLTIDAGDKNIVLDPNVGNAADAFDLTAATFSTFSGVFITAASGNPVSEPVTITANTAGNVSIEIVGNDTDTVATLAAAQGATATGDGASQVLASGDSNKITVTGGSNPIITIKCTSFTGNLTTTGTITVNSGVTVLGTVIDVNNPAGLSSRTFSVSNIILGTTIQIYNETQVTKRGVAEGYTPTNVFETLVASGTTTTSTLIGDGTSDIAALITAAGNGLEADPMADTSYVLPSGWKLETTEVPGDNNRVTISGIYDEGTVPNGDFNVGDSVRVRATCAAATGAFLPFVNSTIANEGGFAIRVVQQADTIYNNNSIDGSASNFDSGTLTLTDDYANLQIDVSDTDNPGQVTVQEIYAKYAYLITTTDGIEHFFGAITAENASNYKINVDIIDLKIQNISASDMIITGARLYRSNGTTIIEKGYLNNDIANGPAGTLSHDTGEFQQFIQPQVESALTAKSISTKTETDSIKKKTDLIPGLL